MNSKNIFNFLLSVTILLAWSSCGPKKYDLAGDANDQKGISIRTEETLLLEEGHFTLSLFGDEKSGKGSMFRHVVQTGTVLEVSQGKVSKIRVFHEVDKSTLEMTFEGKTKRQENNGPMHGATVTQSYNDGVWQKELVNGLPTEEQKSHLSDSKSDWMEEFYPSRRVCFGETWTVPAENFVDIYGANAQAVDGSMIFTFDRIEDYMGQNSAVISAQIETTAKGLDDRNVEFETVINLKGTIYRSLEKFIDIRSELEGSMIVEFELGESSSMKITGPVKMTSTSQLVK